MTAENLESFREHFIGKIILPEDTQYEQSRSVMFGTGTPQLIVVPENSASVASAVIFAKENSLQIAVRSGGHSGAAFGTNTDGIVIDMSAFNSVEMIDAGNHTVRIGAGARWVDVVKKLKEYNLAFSSGDTKSVGVGGLLLGGGIGWLVRKVGLSLDNLLAAEVVTAEGQIVRASMAVNQDLFWAIRGGGGNFGIVTTFECTAFPLTTVFSGPIAYGIDEVASVLKGWRDAMRVAPNELNSTALVMPSFGGNPPGVMIQVCYAGDDESAATAAIAPLKKLGKITMDGVKQKAYADVLEDAYPPKGVEIITKVGFAKELPNALVDAIALQCNAQIPILQIRYLGGAMNAVPVDATAFAHRDSEVLMVSPVFVPPESSTSVINTACAPWQKLATYCSGTYANLLSTNTDEDIQAMYPGETYSRLAHIKKIYDPENLFRGNYNIQPEV